MAQKNEERISTKILFFEKPIDMQKWNLAVKDNVKKYTGLEQVTQNEFMQLSLIEISKNNKNQLWNENSKK